MDSLGEYHRSPPLSPARASEGGLGTVEECSPEAPEASGAGADSPKKEMRDYSFSLDQKDSFWIGKIRSGFINPLDYFRVSHPTISDSATHLFQHLFGVLVFSPTLLEP